MITVDCLYSVGGDLAVVNAARVSFAKETKLFGEKDTKLIRYLAEHKHRSPFNHSFLSFRVKAPIFVARQLVKHEYLPWNEVSRRYVDEEPEFYKPEGWRARAEDKKQGSAQTVIDLDKVITDYEHGWYKSLLDLYECVEMDQIRLYKEFLKAGVAPEQARMVLPLNTMTEWIWSGSLGAFMKMVNLRDHDHTQYETRLVAKLVAKYIQQEFPVSYQALREFPNV